MHSLPIYLLSLASTSWAIRWSNETTAIPQELPRLVLYHQTTHDQHGRPVSLLPLVKESGIALTHLIVCTFHLSPRGAPIHLNDHQPGDRRYDTLWEEVAILQRAGVVVMGMVGGAHPGSFESSTLDAEEAGTFERHYGDLARELRRHRLQGLDLDVEQAMSQRGITRLIKRLAQDFGPGFVITLAPVAAELRGGRNLARFSYQELEGAVGNSIAFYNTQFYNGFGTMDKTDYFDDVVRHGFAPTKIVVGQLTARHGLTLDRLTMTLKDLVRHHGPIGGLMGWEYFGSEPGGQAKPWEWAVRASEILRPNGVPRLHMNRSTAGLLMAAWERSVVMDRAGPLMAFRRSRPSVNVDYMAMVSSCDTHGC